MLSSWENPMKMAGQMKFELSLSRMGNIFMDGYNSDR